MLAFLLQWELAREITVVHTTCKVRTRRIMYCWKSLSKSTYASSLRPLLVALISSLQKDIQSTNHISKASTGNWDLLCSEDRGQLEQGFGVHLVERARLVEEDGQDLVVVVPRTRERILAKYDCTVPLLNVVIA